MKKIFFAFLLATFLIPGVSLAQAPKFEWVRPIVGNYAPDDPGAETYDFKTDQAGNTYLFGNLYGDDLNFGGGIKLTNTDESGTIFLAKIKPNGAAAWATTITTSQDLTGFTFGYYAPGLALDDEGNIFISGTMESDTLSFGNNITLVRDCSDCSHIFVARYNNDGIAQWVSAITGEEGARQEGGKIAVSGNDIYLTGKCEGPVVNFGGNLSFVDLKSNGFFMEKLSAMNGQAAWVKFLTPESGTSRGYQVKTTPSGEAWVVGIYYDSKIDFGNNLTLDLFHETSGQNYFLAKYSAAGIPLEAVNINSTSYMSILDMAVDAQFGGVYLVCDYSDSLFTSNLPVTNVGEYGSSLLYYIGTDVVSLLDVPYEGEGYGITAVASAPDGDFYASGFYEDETLLVGDTLLPNAGCFDSYLYKGNLSSGREWVRSVGGLGCEAIISPYYGQSLDLNAKGDLYATGAYIMGMQIDGTIRFGSGLLVGRLKSETVAANDPIASQPDFSITPNPTSGAFQIHIGEQSNANNGWLVIHDMQGREVCSQTVNAPIMEVNQALAAGAYSVSFFTERHVVRKKLVVQSGR